MLRNIGGVIVGYLVMFAFILITFTVLYLLLGAEGSFQPNSYEISGVWMVLSIILGIVAAVLGGWVCAKIAVSPKAAYVLAVVVLLLGIGMAIPAMSSDSAMPEIRTGDVSNMEAMQNAKTPTWMMFLNPLLGAVGIVIGARMVKKPTPTA